MIHGKFVVVVEDVGNGMDSGCLYDILTECAEHGKILEAYCTGTIFPDNGADAYDYNNSVMDLLESIEQGPIPGKC